MDGSNANIPIIKIDELLGDLIFDEKLSPYFSKAPPKELTIDISLKKGTASLLFPASQIIQYSKPFDPSSSTIEINVKNLDSSFMTHSESSRTITIDPTKASSK